MRCAWIAVTAVLLMCSRQASAQTLVVAIDGALACQSPSELQSVLAGIGMPWQKYVDQPRVVGDKTALKDTLAPLLLSGDCTLLKSDEPVQVTGYSPENRLIKVRRKGFPAQFWTSERSLRRPAS
jgi:hypothetical protein